MEVFMDALQRDLLFLELLYHVAERHGALQELTEDDEIEDFRNHGAKRRYTHDNASKIVARAFQIVYARPASQEDMVL